MDFNNGCLARSICYATSHFLPTVANNYGRLANIIDIFHYERRKVNVCSTQQKNLLDMPTHIVPRH